MSFISSSSGSGSGTSSLDYKESVRAASLANVNLSGAFGGIMDGVTLDPDNRVLLKNQTAPEENGLYSTVEPLDASTWVRTEDADSDSEVTSGMLVYVSEGNANGEKAFILVSPDPITLGASGLVFVQYPPDIAGGNPGEVQFNNSGVLGGDSSVSIDAANNRLDITGTLRLNVAGSGIEVAEGANARMGVATLVAGTVTVSNTSITANTRIILIHQNNSGTIGNLYPSNLVVGTSFDINSDNVLDTSDVLWLLIEPL